MPLGAGGRILWTGEYARGGTMTDDAERQLAEEMKAVVEEAESLVARLRKILAVLVAQDGR